MSARALFTAIERVVLTCPLGVRFCDAATGAAVTDGLRAVAWRAGEDRQRIASVVTRSGVHAFHGLPGLRDFENGAEGELHRSPPEVHRFRVEVRDTFGRFLPCVFGIVAPQVSIAIFDDGESPPGSFGGAVPLFSTAGRSMPAGLGVIRAELRESASHKPAAWAFVEATHVARAGAIVLRGLAGRDGRLTLPFRYPEGARTSSGGSPPPGERGLAKQQWTFTLRFFHKPRAPKIEPENFADYDVRLHQPAVEVAPTSPPHDSVTVTLTFGQELDPPLLLDLAAP